MERFFNGDPTLLTTQILDTDNPALFEVDNDELPLDVDYIIKIGAEYLRVTSIDITAPPYIFTADRGLEGSAAATHDIGATVVHLLTAGSLGLILEEQNEHLPTADTTLNRVGRVQNTDQKTLVDLGASFAHHFVDRFLVTPINTGDWALQNTDDLSQNAVNDILKLKRVSPSSAGLTLFTTPLATFGSSGFNIGFQLATGAIASQTPAFGIGVYDSSNDKHVVALHGIKEAAPIVYNKIERWTNFTTLSSTPLAPLAAYPASMIFMRVEFDGTDIDFYYSYDNDEYVFLGTTLESFLTIDEFAIAIAPHAVANLFHVGA